jgi:hypothetical protein
MWQTALALLGAAAGTAFSGLFVYRTLSSHALQRRLKRERQGYGEEDFVRELTEEGIPKELATKIYAHFQSLLGVRDFPVQPSDSLRDLYGIDRFGGPELSETLEELCRSRAWKKWRGGRPHLVTVKDLALEIARLEPPGSPPAPP